MAHIFTITDSLNLSEEAINNQAQAISLSEISEFELSPKSKLKQLKVNVENGTKVYTFEIIAEEGINSEDTDSSSTIIPTSQEIAAASVQSL